VTSSNAIFYLLRTGCPWCYLPRDSFPPRSTVYNIFGKFQRDGVWEAIWAELHMALRTRDQPNGTSAVSLSRLSSRKASARCAGASAHKLARGLGQCGTDAAEGLFRIGIFEPPVLVEGPMSRAQCKGGGNDQHTHFTK
jgi:transposase